MRKTLAALLFAALAAVFALPVMSQGQPQAVQTYAPLTRPVTMLTLTAQTGATLDGATQNGYNTSRVICAFNQSAISNSPSSVLKIQNRDVASGLWYDLIAAAAVTSAINTPAVIAAGAGVATAANVGIGMPVASQWRVRLIVAGTTPVVTGTVGCSVQ